MSDLVLLPDAEQVISAYLRGRPEIQDLVDDRVFTELPGLRKDQQEWRFPAVRITRIGGSPALAYPLVLDRPTTQVDVWGGPKSTARRIAETCRAVLALAHLEQHELAVVYAPKPPNGGFGPLSYLPDDDFTPARPRYTFDVTLPMRARAGATGS